MLDSIKTPHFGLNSQNGGIGSKRRRDAKKKTLLRNAKKKILKESFSGIFRSPSLGRKGKVL